LEGFSLDFNELLAYQQNRYPYLMIDGITEVVPGVRASGFKNITWNEWYMPCHFPGMPNMPGALQIEAIAQVFTVAITTLEGNKGKLTNFLSADKIKFKKRVEPGSRLDIETEVFSYKRGVASGRGTGYIGGVFTVCAEIVITLPDVMDQYTPKKKRGGN
jgi:3-hydroxyacyl-[acyl-carrier-protein] dehydratase